MAIVVGALGSETGGTPARGAVADPRLTNLPTQLTSFVGRADDIRQVDHLLDHRRMVTLTGIGGCGKTRLAIEAATRRIGRRPELVLFVDLARHDDADSALTAVSDAVGSRRAGMLATVDVAGSIGDRAVLLMLDNCEHLVEWGAAVADDLLRRCPSLRILATSREPLGLGGETTFRVPSLGFPDDGALGADAAGRFDSVRLFVDRGQRARPDFVLDDATAPGVVEICRNLEGLPLAIELAAARLRVLDPSEIVAGLENRFRLLTGGPRTGDLRHRTLQASVDWSYGLLDAEEQKVLARLSVFTGGFRLPATERVCGGDGVDGSRVLNIVLRLADKSLVTVSGLRFSLLETIRQYAAARLEDAGETEATRARHYAYFLEAVRQPTEGTSERQYRNVIDEDYENIRRALRWASEQDDPAVLARMASRLNIYWLTGKRMSDGARWLEEVVGRERDPRRRAKALHRLSGMLWIGAREVERAEQACEEALTILRETGDPDALAEALLSIPIDRQRAAHFDEAIALLKSTGSPLVSWAVHVRAFWTLAFDPDEAGALFDKAVDLANDLGLAWAERIARARRALQRLAVGEVASALPALEAAAHELRTAGEGVVRPDVLASVAVLRELTGDAAGADAAIEELAELCEQGESAMSAIHDLDARVTLAMVRGEWDRTLAMAQGWTKVSLPASEQARRLCHLALAEALAGQHTDAVADARRSATLLRDDWPPGAQFLPFLGFLPGELPLAIAARGAGDLAEAEVLVHEAIGAFMGKPRPLLTRLLPVTVLASIWGRQQRFDDAVRLVAGVRAAGDLAGLTWDNAMLTAAGDGVLDAARVAQGPDRFEEVWAEGAAMSWDEVVGFAQRGWGPRRRPVHGWASLTPTERHVADLVAGGATNKEVAQRLLMSVPTVKTHLTHVYAKIGVTNRAQLAAEAGRRPS